MSRNSRDVVLAEADFMLDAGESPTTIANMLGIKPGSVARALFRAGRADLARRFEAARRAQDGGTCIDCQAPTSRPRTTRCKPCGHRERERLKREGGVHCPVPHCPRFLHDGRCTHHGRKAA